MVSSSLGDAMGAKTADRPLVVVVDDDPAVCNSLKFSLELEGFTVWTFFGGAELLAVPDLPRQGCLVIDYSMPEMNGLELLAQLRRRNICMPAILVTTHPSNLVRRSARVAGAPLVEKPFLGNALVETIRGTLDPRPAPE